MGLLDLGYWLATGREREQKEMSSGDYGSYSYNRTWKGWRGWLNAAIRNLLGCSG